MMVAPAAARTHLSYMNDSDVNTAEHKGARKCHRLVVLLRREAEDLGSSSHGPLRRLPVERVNLLRADVAQHQRRVIRRQAGPVSSSPPGLAEILQADYLLQSVI